MNARFACAFVSASAIGLAAMAHAGAKAPVTAATKAADHRAMMATVATYKPMAGFNHVVGNVRFFGSFLSEGDRCDVTVFQTLADGGPLATRPERANLVIEADGRAELAAGPDSALAIACVDDASLIKIAPQYAPARAASN